MIVVGRSPMEHVEVPKEIYKKIRKFYRGAIIAHQSGETLAGNFLLRTLVEQWSRFFCRDAGARADQAIDSYMETLPSGFNDIFPSLRKVYEVLSIDIHSATGSEDVFESALSDIKKHFEGRLVTGKQFKLSNPRNDEPAEPKS